MANKLYELSDLRNINSKHFVLDDGNNAMEAHVGHIHYFNKLGVGDGQKRYREIDFTLSWDEAKRGWNFAYHSFQPFLPEYADEWIEFRDLFEDKDQTIRYKAVASHVKGRLVMPSEIGIEDLTGVNCVIYDNAFGEGKDLILYFTRSTLAKVVRVRESYKASQDMSFDFEVDFPQNKAVKRGFKDNIAYQLDTLNSKTFDSNKQTLIGDDLGNGKEWHTYLRPFSAWDSKRKITINVEYRVEQGKTYLRKTIPVYFLTSSIGDVFTDDFTSYYSGAGDGGATHYYDASAQSWANARGGAGNYSNYNHTTNIQDGAYGYSAFTLKDGQGGHQIGRGFLPVDSSALNDGANITGAILYLYKNASAGNTNDDNDSQAYIGVVKTYQASTSQLQNDDYVDCGSDNDTAGRANTTPIQVAATRTLANIVGNSGYQAFTFTNYLTWIKKGVGEITQLGIREGHDIEDSPMSTGNNTNNRVTFYASEYTGTSEDPYLYIEYNGVSISPSPSASESASASPSLSSSQSLSPSPSSSESPSPSSSLSSSESLSASASESSSESSSPSLSGSASSSQSSSQSLSPSASPSPSSSESSSGSSSQSLSVSSSPSPSSSQSASLSSSESASPSSGSNTVYKIVFINDMHLYQDPPDDVETDWETRFPNKITAMDGEGADRLILLGDVIHADYMDQTETNTAVDYLKTQVDTLGIPYDFVWGNHEMTVIDGLTYDAGAQVANRLDYHSITHTAPRKTTVTKDGLTIDLVYLNFDPTVTSPYNGTWCTVPAEDLTWLTNNLGSNPTFVFIHADPITSDAPNGYHITNRTDLLNTLNGHNVKALFFGHDHDLVGYQATVNGIAEIAGRRSGSSWGQDQGYSVLEISSTQALFYTRKDGDSGYYNAYEIYNTSPSSSPSLSPSPSSSESRSASASQSPSSSESPSLSSSQSLSPSPSDSLSQSPSPSGSESRSLSKSLSSSSSASQSLSVSSSQSASPSPQATAKSSILFDVFEDVPNINISY